MVPITYTKQVTVGRRHANVRAATYLLQLNNIRRVRIESYIRISIPNIFRIGDREAELDRSKRWKRSGKRNSSRFTANTERYLLVDRVQNFCLAETKKSRILDNSSSSLSGFATWNPSLVHPIVPALRVNSSPSR